MQVWVEISYSSDIMLLMQHFPEPIAGAFIVNKEGQLFLMKSHKWKDTYVVPGGHIEVGETIEQALKREVKEETGLEVINPHYLCLWEFIQEEEFHTKKHMIFLNYKVTAISEKVTLNEEAEDYVWVTKEEALGLPLEKYTKITLEKYSAEIFS